MESCQRTCCKLTDVSVPCDHNTSTKVTEKISKCKVLEIEITEIRRVKTEIVPVIVSELALISKGMEHNLRKISGAININNNNNLYWDAIERTFSNKIGFSKRISMSCKRSGLETFSAHTRKIYVHPVKYPSSTSGPRNGPDSSRVQEAIYSTSTM